jgi:hypothetical protein
MGVDGTYGLVPTPDSTEELQVLTAPFSAQYGQSGGDAVLTTTKSGTEKFHGSAFESYNSQSLNALGFFTVPGTVINPSSFHYFGGSIGGPVLIPKLFDGRKHRLYFFTDWEDTLTHANSPYNVVVPTAAELTGDFSGPSPQHHQRYRRGSQTHLRRDSRARCRSQILPVLRRNQGADTRRGV